ncbi:MAG: CDP-alcohol phosphatidyltransferase family protein [Alphaproteobacteria bacterium]|nr:CDP-alcohol phosphatidyltransferase family protein [Alphaproteobacteria bacterium]
MNLPNLISLGRLLCVPLTIWCVLQDRLDLAFWVFVAAGASDGVDGFLARRFGWRTQLGAYLDPVADKALLVSIYVLLGARGLLPDWLVVLVVLRDVTILGGAFVVMREGTPMAIVPMFISKANTALQIVLAGSVLAQHGFALDLAAVNLVLVYAAAATTIASGIGYIFKWGRQATGWERRE